MFLKLKILQVLIFVLWFGCFSAGAQTILKFDFGGGRAARGFRQVSEKDIYSKEKGYGFESAENIKCVERTKGNDLQLDFCSSDRPFYFSAAVAEGNYKVSVTFGDAEMETHNTVKAELRRLMLENIKTKKGKLRTETFIVNVRTPKISTGGEVKLKDREKTMEWWAWDEKLTLEFNGRRPSVTAVEIEKIETLPTIYLLGDSTVCDQPREPYASWGQMLTRFFAPTAAIASHAESGESLKSSFGARRLEKVLSLLKSGDYVLIQFAHNDEKDKSDGAGPFTTFKALLKQYVSAIKAKGGIPIPVTPMHRRTFDQKGRITNSHGDYPEAVRQVAREENLDLIDLTAMSQDFYEALGKERSGLAFKEGDGTHHNNYGAYELARMVVESIRRQKLALAKFLRTEIKTYDPKKPGSPESFSLLPSPLVTDLKPLGN